jgi:hypothetical protein
VTTRIAPRATVWAAALLLVSAPVLLASDAVTECGSAEAKILGAFLKGVTAEATKACVAGFAGHPQPVDSAALTALTDKINGQIQAAIDKFGDANCFQKPNGTADNTISTAQNLANELCLVPSPTPTP